MANGLTNGNGHRKGFDLDVRGLLAIMSVTGAFSLAFAQLFIQASVGAEIPAWAAAIVAGVTGFYFGSRAGSDSGAVAGIQAGANVASLGQWYQSQEHLSVVHRLEEAEKALAALRGETPSEPST